MEIKKSTSIKEKIITTIILVVSLFVLSALVPFLKIRVLTHFFPLIYAIICCYYLMKYTVNKYTYTFNDNNLLIEKTTGRTTTPVFDVKYTKIKSVDKKEKKAFCLTVSPFNKNCLYLTFLDGKKEKVYKIHNDENIILAFKEKVGEKIYE